MIGSLESTTVRVSPVRRSKFRSNHLICHIDVSAFLAVVVALLYLLMAPSFFPDFHPQKLVDLAKVGHARSLRAADREDALVVAVTRDGSVYMGVEKLRAQDLPDKIQEGVRHGAENRVYIKADARARFRDVSAVLDEVRASGVENVAFLTDQRRPPAQ